MTKPSSRECYDFLVESVLDHATTLPPARRAKTYRGLAEIIPNPTIQAELLSLAADIEAAERRHCELKLKIVAKC